MIKCHSTYSTQAVSLVLISAVKRTQALVVPTTHELLCEKAVQEVRFFFLMWHMFLEIYSTKYNHEESETKY